MQEKNTYLQRFSAWLPAIRRFSVGTGLIILALLAIAFATIQRQEQLLFPSLAMTATKVEMLRTRGLPDGVESMFIPTSDGEVLEMWRMAPAEPRADQPVALFFHGNGDTLDSPIWIQQWLTRLGFINYSIDYRGIGKSSGFPSEEGLYRDAEALYAAADRREGLAARGLLIVGYSLGSGPASFLAGKLDRGSLLLLAPFYSLRDVVAEQPYYSLLLSFLRFVFPVSEHIQNFAGDCIIAAHGDQDRVIGAHHSTRLKSAYRGKARFLLIRDLQAHHGNIIGAKQAEIEAAVASCMSAK